MGSMVMTQEPTYWRYLPWIKPMFQAYVYGISPKNMGFRPGRRWLCRRARPDPNLTPWRDRGIPRVKRTPKVRENPWKSYLNGFCLYVFLFFLICICKYCNYTYIYMYTCIHTYIHPSMHPSIHTYLHTYIHTYIHACTYIHMYICICICVCACVLV